MSVPFGTNCRWDEGGGGKGFYWITIHNLPVIFSTNSNLHIFINPPLPLGTRTTGSKGVSRTPFWFYTSPKNIDELRKLHFFVKRINSSKWIKSSDIIVFFSNFMERSLNYVRIYTGWFFLERDHFPPAPQMTPLTLFWLELVLLWLQT